MNLRTQNEKINPNFSFESSWIPAKKLTCGTKLPKKNTLLSFSITFSKIAGKSTTIKNSKTKTKMKGKNSYAKKTNRTKTSGSIMPILLPINPIMVTVKK